MLQMADGGYAQDEQEEGVGATAGGDGYLGSSAREEEVEGEDTNKVDGWEEC